MWHYSCLVCVRILVSIGTYARSLTKEQFPHENSTGHIFYEPDVYVFRCVFYVSQGEHENVMMDSVETEGSREGVCISEIVFQNKISPKWDGLALNLWPVFDGELHEA